MIGIVGGIGAGKSAVAAALAARGAFVIDADKVGHALLNQPPVLERVLSRFGPEVLATPGEDGAPRTIDRRVLGTVVFNDPAARKALESILHPRMRSTFAKAIARTIRRGRATAVVLDAAILFEAGWHTLCDRVLFVEAPLATRIRRLASERGWTEEKLLVRERTQAPLEEKRAKAFAVVANSDGPEALEAEVDRVWQSVLASPPPPRRSGAAVGVRATSQGSRPKAPGPRSRPSGRGGR